MKQFLIRIQDVPRIPLIFWLITAVLTWGGLIASLPGHYYWYFVQPILLKYSNLHTLLSFACGIAAFLCAAISLTLGTFLFLRKPGDRAALYVSFFLLGYGFTMSGPLENIEYMILGESGAISYRLQAVIFLAPMILLLLTFPNGVITPAPFRWLIPLIIPLMLALSVLPLNEINSTTTLRSKLLYGYEAGLFLCALGAQVYRYLKKSSPIERQQTKIAVFGIGIQFILLGISSTIYFQTPADVQQSPLPDFVTLLWWVSLAILPISLSLAVIRSHLWDIDVVIRRTLIYGVLTAALALLYSGSVILMQQGFRLVAGHESPIAIVVSTLVIAGLFSPLRGRIQSVIDRRFYRSKYNSEQVLARLQQSLRERVDLYQIESELTGVVMTTVQPEWTMLWIREPVKE